MSLLSNPTYAMTCCGHTAFKEVAKALEKRNAAIVPGTLAKRDDPDYQKVIARGLYYDAAALTKPDLCFDGLRPVYKGVGTHLGNVKSLIASSL